MASPLPLVGNQAGPDRCAAHLPRRRSRDEYGAQIAWDVSSLTEVPSQTQARASPVVGAGMEERMDLKYQLPALILAVALITIAVALLNTGKVGSGLILGMVALISVRWCARRCADRYLTDLHTQHGDRTN
jgi:hypothetical protein